MSKRDHDRNAPAFRDLALFATPPRVTTALPMTPAFYDATIYERARDAIRTLPPTAMLSDCEASRRCVCPLTPRLRHRDQRTAR